MPVELVVADLKGADDPLHLIRKVLVDKDKTIPLDNTIHPLQRSKIITKQDLDPQFVRNRKWFSCSTSFYDAAACLIKKFWIHFSIPLYKTCW